MVASPQDTPNKYSGFTFKKTYAETQQDAAIRALCRAVEDSIRMSRLYPVGRQGSLFIDEQGRIHLQPAISDGRLEGFENAAQEATSRQDLVSDTHPSNSDLLSNHSSGDTVDFGPYPKLGFLSIAYQGNQSNQETSSRALILELPGYPLHHDMGQLSRGWLRKCEGHKSCSQFLRDVLGAEDASIFPTRLLRIQRVNDDLQVRICELAGNQTREKHYTALSHCWGVTDLVKTTTSRLEKFKVGVPHSKLSPTILRAIEITHAAGLSYIWIGSLCIVQDDPADRASESPRMVRHTHPLTPFPNELDDC